MKIDRAAASRVWHGVLALIVFASLITQITLTATRGGEPAVTRFERLFSYFTIQSNLLLLAAIAALTVNPHRDGRLWRIVRLDALLGIVITGIVYSTILAGQSNPQGAAWWADLGFHYIAPWTALAGWLFFGPHRRIDARTLAWASVWPLLWITWTLAHGAATDWYPYPFTDVSRWGYPAVLINLGVVVLIAVLLGAALRLLDTRLPGGSPAAPEAPAAVVAISGSAAESETPRVT
ncbi:Pr6Pr family membrane protein [Actinoplanes sichuanensis]|uniref:Pr6Pr family membrane protein n=1 Tax=Actinoplanes sichuanensis TaxID=512349 RepID=A0ABW4AT66_9ACTN|nr:Pr6Pr family membrane protein [Actinoplanes sichuanensis]BEL07386.1 Pr6Pr family membrane protein [Actinoplanes sichuanensis]